jgi:lysophospholipase
MRWLKTQAEKVTTPMLVVGAGKDRICLTPEAKAFASRAPGAQYAEIADAGHEVLMEKNVYRAQFWEAFDAFVAAQPHAQ